MVKLTIILHEDGKSGVEGPLENPILCYGLLELGRQAIEAFGKRSPIEVAHRVPIQAEH